MFYHESETVLLGVREVVFYTVSSITRILLNCLQRYNGSFSVQIMNIKQVF